MLSGVTLDERAKYKVSSEQWSQGIVQFGYWGSRWEVLDRGESLSMREQGGEKCNVSSERAAVYRK